MGKSENYLFYETNAVFGLRVAWSIQLNELIKLSEYQRPLRFQSFKVKTCFSQKQLGDLEPKFIWKLMGEWEWKFV